MTNWKQFTAPNLGLLFYKQLYKDVKNVRKRDGESMLIIDKNALVFNVDKKISEFNAFYTDMYENKLSYYKPSIAIGNQSFTLFTTYPGLLVGTGYMHSTKSTGDATLGFFFDHTTGLPIIPGSSVKGVLRSLFELADNAKAAMTFILNELLEKEVTEPLKTEINAFKENLDEKLKDWLKNIFGDEDMGGKDVFFDAVIDIEQSKSHTFLASDYLTPHTNPLKNPTPLQLIKVLPNVAFQFRFQLKNDSLGSSALKTAIFKQILLTIGIGAKTNVGYGQFSEKPMEGVGNNSPIHEEKKKEEMKGDKNIPTGEVIPNIVASLPSGTFIENAIITKVSETHIVISFTVQNPKAKSVDKGSITRKLEKFPNAKEGQSVKLKLNAAYTIGQPLNVKIMPK